MYLGIDLGTTGVKVVLINTDQELIASHTEKLSVSRPQPLWSEQNPEDWWQATQKAILTLKEHHAKALSCVQAIGLSGQMHGATVLDKNNNVLRPAILWNDGRSMAESEVLMAETKATEITGNLVMPGFTAPKLLWLKNNEPDIFAKIAKILLPKDYIRWQLSGDFATDMSDASGTSWLNVAERCWSDEMLGACGLQQSHMPQLFEGSEVTGTIKPELAKTLGLASDAKIVAGGGDNAASAISTNTFADGDAFLSLGTSGVYFVANQHYHANPQQAVHAYCHCLPQRWHQMSVHLSAASCLDWAAKLLHCGDVATLLKLAEEKQTTNVTFLPYLSGERTPHNNPYARSVFFGMDNDTSKADLALAVIEGVAFAIADGQEAMLSDDTEINEIAVVGGGAQSLYWGKIIAAALGRPLHYRASREVGAAFGAARLAWLAIQGGDPKTVFKAAALEYEVSVDDKLAEKYMSKRQQFNELYQNLKPNFQHIY